MFLSQHSLTQHLHWSLHINPAIRIIQSFRNYPNCGIYIPFGYYSIFGSFICWETRRLFRLTNCLLITPPLIFVRLSLFLRIIQVWNNENGTKCIRKQDQDNHILSVKSVCLGLYNFAEPKGGQWDTSLLPLYKRNGFTIFICKGNCTGSLWLYLVGYQGFGLQVRREPV